ncbi:carbamate kinase [Ferrimonas futtsuensis]|uniref:carbamate kinase n=1 Tax=Ferrimonas futtsuensis TaxID=364764 RepID=UPI0003F7BBF4|nr:carbamate kinase [Ferrimonas futtsuensis]
MTEPKPILVVAVGGNALLQRGQAMTCDNQRLNIAQSTAALARLSESYRLVIVHGNGPQVGLLALQNLAYSEVPSYPLDVLGAESQGMIGYMLAQGLKREAPEARITTLLTQIEVSEQDPAFSSPDKFIGPIYTREEADRMASAYGWTVKADGPHWRRVVPSPRPMKIVEIDAIRNLLDAGETVICCGGGGAPVVRGEQGISGVEAVIDKDLAAALLARELNAEHLIILTDAENVVLDWGTPMARPLTDISVEEIRQYEFAKGSMAPKVDAACNFALQTGGIGHIGALSKVEAIMQHRSGTHIAAIG